MQDLEDLLDRGASTADFPDAYAGLDGEDVRFQALGGKLPALDVVHKFPLVLHLEEPSLEVPTEPKRKISRSEDLRLVWTRGAPDVEMWFVAYASEKGISGTHVTCHFASVSGQGTVPHSALTKLAGNAYVLLRTVGLRTVQHGDFTTTLAVATNVLTPTKMPIELVFE